jgi:molecular chaperone DnaK (HSP70)
VQELLKYFFDKRKELCKSIHLDEAIAYGVAMQVVVLNGNHTIGVDLKFRC